MQDVSVKKKYTIEAGHILADHPGQCANVHGHSYKIFLEVYGMIDPVTGMVIDFGALNDCACRLLDPIDHAFIMAGDTPLALAVLFAELNYKVYTLEAQTSTAENLAQLLAYQLWHDLAANFPDAANRTSWVAAEVYETEKAVARSVYMPAHELDVLMESTWEQLMLEGANND